MKYFFARERYRFNVAKDKGVIDMWQNGKEIRFYSYTYRSLGNNLTFPDKKFLDAPSTDKDVIDWQNAAKKGFGVTEDEARAILGRLRDGWQYVPREQLIEMAKISKSKKEISESNLVSENALIVRTRKWVNNELAKEIVWHWIDCHPATTINKAKLYQSFTLKEFIADPKVDAVEFFMKNSNLKHLLKAFAGDRTFLDGVEAFHLVDQF